MSQIGGFFIVMLLPALALGQQAPGLYIDVEGGTHFATPLPAGNATKVYTDPGAVDVISLGWEFSNGFRSEIEGSLRLNSANGVSTRPGAGTLVPLDGAAGTMLTYAVMANIRYDIPFHPFGLPLTPYVGAGAGYGWLDLTGVAGPEGVGQGNVYASPTAVAFGSAGAFAYQTILGASLPIRILPGLDATMEYRFLGMARADIPTDRGGGNSPSNQSNGAAAANVSREGFEVRDNAILIGLRYSFGGP